MAVSVADAHNLYLISYHYITLPQVKDLQAKGYPWKFVEIPGRGGAVGVQFDAETIYSPEEMVAMSFEHIKSICETDAGGNVKVSR